MTPELSAYIARRERLLTRLRGVLAVRLDLDREPDELDPDVPLFGTGFGLDSLDSVEILVCLDREFDVSLPNEPGTWLIMRTMNTIVDHLMTYDEASDGG